MTAGRERRVSVYDPRGEHPIRTLPAGAATQHAATGRVLTPSLNSRTPTGLDPDGRVLRRVRVAPAAHDACVVR